MKRKIRVPGKATKMSVVISDAMKRVVVAVPHAGEVVMVFIGEQPAAHIMSVEEAEEFRVELRKVHQAIYDDVEIEQMEKMFSTEGEDSDDTDG